MFNLIVTFQPWAKGNNLIMPDRLLSYTADDVLAVVSPDGKPDFGKLRSLPTLFVEECPNDGPQLAYFGTVRAVAPDGRGFHVDAAFEPGIPPIPVRMLKTRSFDLGVTNEFEWATTHWAVKNVDLFQALFRVAITQRRRPSAFKISDHQSIDPRLIAVMMPFHPDFHPVYEALGAACDALRLDCRRADDLWKHDTIMDDVAHLIDTSRAVIADCTGRSANVFYEIGIAHALGKTVIPIAQSKDDIPFDIGHLRYALYENTPNGLEELKAVIRGRLNELPR